MAGKIPGMTRLEGGINLQTREGAWDLALYAEFYNREWLDGYQNHPEHLKVSESLKCVRDQRAGGDF